MNPPAADTPLLVCADDFGYSDVVDAGIAGLVEAGRVTATSCLTASPRWTEAAARARALRSQADVGLHLDLTEFETLGSLPRVLLAARLGLLESGRVQQAVRRQLDAFESALGVPPDYVDGHQHVHQLPLVTGVLLEELERRYGAAHRPWVRVSRPTGSDAKSRIIGALGATSLTRALDAAGLPHTTRLLGIYDFSPAPPYAERLGRWLSSVQPGDALMVHPAIGVTTGDPLGAAREREYHTLLSPGIAALLARLRITLCRGDTLRIRAA